MNDTNNTKGLSPHFVRAFDYSEGDIVQLSPGAMHAGKIGKIISILASDPMRGRSNELSYFIKLSDGESIAVYKERIRLVRAAGSDSIEENSKFFDL